ncbi:MAG: glutamate-5-semialdehyde dehydrogenase [Verrucomicrobia bacterium]|nr:glutamate-5-semialdehyde dehydrogenase [Verrucomicrobiota bacterium]MDA1088494.1 glutamate-5-semialdehyde dehydrogenase [Verrucomicrobiota bacterium]
MGIRSDMLAMGDRAVAASRELVTVGTKKKSAILRAMADELRKSHGPIEAANQKDLEAGEKIRLSSSLLDRLELTSGRIDAMADGLDEVARLADPVGEIISEWVRPNGLKIDKVRVPIGVIGIIYESRPNVTADAAALCLKTSNAVILRGGKEAIHSNRAIATAMTTGGRDKGLPDGAIQLVQTTSRDAVRELCRMVGRVDMIIPRGGEGLIKAVSEQALVPVVKHYKGVCHTYVDQSANLEQAMNISMNAKTQRPGVCNAMETLLVHEAVAAEFLPEIGKRLESAGVEIRGDATTRLHLEGVKAATEKDWSEEYLDLILSIRVVSSAREAIDHINNYGSHHSDAIIAESDAVQNQFLKEVDSATVYVNASTRFTDGNEFGMGAEIGISTDKLHARGPMGLEELTTYKYVIFGKGQIKE